MIRWGAMLAAVFAAGLAAGWLLSGVRTDTASKITTAALPPHAQEIQALRSEIARIEDERAMLAARNDALEADAAAMRIDQSLMDEILQEATLPEPAPEPSEAAPPARPGGDRRWDRPQPTPEQMAEFRKNFEAQQSRMLERLTEQLTQMDDPNAIENFNALMELQQKEQELRRQLRDAATDEARSKIEARLREIRQASGQMLDIQQDALLRNLAASSGINDADAQAKFMNEFRATLDNPFFRMEPMLLGNGGPGRGGPRGMGFGGPRGGN